MRAITDFTVHPDLDPGLQAELPRLYYLGRLNTIFTSRRFASWLLYGIFTSIFTYFIPLYVFTESMILKGETGETVDMWIMSQTNGLIIVVLANLLIWILTRYFTYITAAMFFVFSFGFYYGYLWFGNG